MNEDLDRSIKRWTQLTLFVKEFTPSAIKLPLFTQHAADFVKQPIEKAAAERRMSVKAEAVSQSERSSSWPQPSSLFPSTDEEKRKKDFSTRCKTKTLKAGYF